MGSAFDNLVDEAAVPVLQEYHGVTAVYHSARGGQARSITVVRDDDSDEIRATAESDGEDQFEETWILVTRDAAGIATPEHGDTILFSDDAPDAAWGFTHRVRNILESSWELQFRRVRPHTRGPAGVRS
jgi:hypothetical protein